MTSSPLLYWIPAFASISKLLPRAHVDRAAPPVSCAIIDKTLRYPFHHKHRIHLAPQIKQHGNVTFSFLINGSTFCVSSSEMPRITSPCGANCSYSFKVRHLFSHGGHHVAQKFTTTTFQWKGHILPARSLARCACSRIRSSASSCAIAARDTVVKRRLNVLIPHQGCKLDIRASRLRCGAGALARGS